MITSILKRHMVAWICAVAIGLLTGLPQLFAIHKEGEAWQGIYPAYNDDEYYYLARGQEVRDGNFTITQPYLHEGKDSYSLQFWVPDAVAGYIGKIFSLSAPQTFILFDFISPPIIFLLLYAIALSVLKTRTEALSYSIIMSAGVFFYTFGRPVSPQIVIIPLLCFLYALHALLTREEKKWWLLLLGISFGTLFHAYTYFWTYATVVLGLLGLGLLYLKKYDCFKRVFVAGLIGVGIGIPYFILLKNIFSLEVYIETIERVGMIGTHFPSGILIVAFAGLYTACFVLLLSRNYISIDCESVYVSSLILASAIVVNQHIVTGQNLEFSSHYRTPAILVATLGAFFLWSHLSKKLETFRTRTWIPIFILGCVIAISIPQVIGIVRTQSMMQSDSKALQRYGNVLSWIDGNQGVYFAHQELSALIPAYTDSDVFYAREANMHFMSDADVVRRYVGTHYFDASFTRDVVLREERYVFGTYYINRHQHITQQNKLRAFLMLDRVSVDRYPEEKIKDVLYTWEVEKAKTLTEVFEGYAVDYIVWDTMLSPEWKLQDQIGLQKVYEDGDIIVYMR